MPRIARDSAIEVEYTRDGETHRAWGKYIRMDDDFVEIRDDIHGHRVFYPRQSIVRITVLEPPKTEEPEGEPYNQRRAW